MQAQTINSNWAGNKYRPASGMIPRKQETLKGPVTLARIGHSLKDGKAQNHNDNLGSPWWMSVGSMEYLWSIARNTNTSLATIVRQKCCIPYYWNSACDLVYEVELSGLADCWIGPGTFFFPEKDAKNSHLASTDIWPQNDVTFFPAGALTWLAPSVDPDLGRPQHALIEGERLLPTRGLWVVVVLDLGVGDDRPGVSIRVDVRQVNRQALVDHLVGAGAGLL